MLLALAAAPALAASATTPPVPPAALPAAALAPAPALSLSHFDHLYADIEIDGKPMAVLRIYANYPDYAYAIEPREGYACVDDAARAIVMLAQEWRRHPSAELLRKIRLLSEFVLHMQNSNGYFNNFIWNDGSINTTYQTSVAQLNWWSLRALAGLEAALPLLAGDAMLAARMQAASARLVGNLERDLLALPHSTTLAAGISVPSWLPAESGADQAAEAVLALLPYYRRTGSTDTRRLIVALADGMLLMQKGDAGHYPYGMFLSWRNTWHAWGNQQAYALLLAGQALDRPAYQGAALEEVDHFYPYLLDTGLAEAIELRAAAASTGGLAEQSRRRFPQIAYGLRPMIYASLKAYALTGAPRYLATATRLGSWLSGRNDAGSAIYQPASGIAFDGIVGPGQLNRNSGAESTVEALLSLQALRDGVQ